MKACMRLGTLAFLPHQHFSQVPFTVTAKRGPGRWRNSVIPQQEKDGWIKAIKFHSAVIGSTDWK